MNIDSIENGYVIDHIPAGVGMKIYNHLSLNKLDCQVAIITNANKTDINLNEVVEDAEKSILNISKLRKTSEFRQKEN